MSIILFVINPHPSGHSSIMGAHQRVPNAPRSFELQRLLGSFSFPHDISPVEKERPELYSHDTRNSSQNQRQCATNTKPHSTHT
jgi:hypothetical protein